MHQTKIIWLVLSVDLITSNCVCLEQPRLRALASLPPLGVFCAAMHHCNAVKVIWSAIHRRVPQCTTMRWWELMGPLLHVVKTILTSHIKRARGMRIEEEREGGREGGALQ